MPTTSSSSGASLHQQQAALAEAKANVEKLDAGPKGVVIQFRDKQFPNPAALVQYIAGQGSLAKIRPDQSVFLMRDLPSQEKRLAGAAVVMTQLAKLAEAA